MWQRIQTLFLGLVVATMIVGLFFPMWVHTDGEVTRQLYPLHFSEIHPGTRTTTYFPYALTATFMVAAATVALMAIRRYDSRITQIKLGTLNSLLLAAAMVCLVVFYRQVAETYGGGRFGTTLWIVFAGVTCNWLAVRFIRRDEKLVRDSQRLR